MATFNRLHLIRQVDLFTLRLFLSAIEEQQIGLAAIRENIAASTATKRIQALEDIAGVKLLDRGPKGVVPSAAGAVLARYARDIFQSLENLRSEVAALTEGVQGELTVVSARSIIVPFLARELGDYGKEYPLVDIAVHEVDNTEIAQQVASGEADLGIFAAQHGLDLAGVDVVPYRRDSLVVILPAGHPLNDQRTIAFRDLITEKLVAPGAMVGAFRAAATRIGQEFDSRHVVHSVTVAVSLVAAGLGVSVVPECLVGPEWRDRLSIRELDETWAVRKLHLVTPRGRGVNPAARALIKQLLDRPQSYLPAVDLAAASESTASPTTGGVLS